LQEVVQKTKSQDYYENIEFEKIAIVSDVNVRFTID
jgi:hypothetical protein